MFSFYLPLPKITRKNELQNKLKIITHPLFNSQTFFTILLNFFTMHQIFENDTIFLQIFLKPPFSFFYAQKKNLIVLQKKFDY